MTTVPVTLNVGKETKEALDALAKLLDVVLDKERRKNMAEYVSQFTSIMTAVDGADLIDDENKVKEIRTDNVAYFVKLVQEKI